MLVSVGADGRAADFAFTSPCQPDAAFMVPSGLRQCIGRRLAEWQWLTITPCPGDDHGQYYYTELASLAVRDGRKTDWRREYRMLVDNGACVGGGTAEASNGSPWRE